MRKQFDINNLVRPNIAAMTAYSSARDEFKDFDQEMIFLDANENPFDTKVNRYPDPNQTSLKSLLAKLRGVQSSHILVGNGSDEVLDLLFRAFCIPANDNIITVPPTYGMYKVLAQTNDIQNQEVLLTSNFQLDVTTILSKVNERTKMIFVCSPNNPTGNILSSSSITALLENFDGLLILDEAYIDFSESSSWVKQLENYPNLIVTQTLSKAYGLAGIRLGICYAGEDIITILSKIKPPYNVNSLSQERAFERLKSQEKVSQEVQTILEGKKQLTKALNEVSFVKEVFPSEANFILTRVDDASLRYTQLIDRGIVVRNRSNQPLCSNTLRFTIGTAKENARLITILNELQYE